MKTRVISAFCLLAVLYCVLRYLPADYALYAIAALLLPLAYEWSALIMSNKTFIWLFAVCTAASSLLLPYVSFIDTVALLAVAVGWLCALCIVLYPPCKSKCFVLVPKYFALGASLLFAHCALLMFAWVLYDLFPHLWSLIILVALVDSGAYASGKLFGAHTFAPVISPNKTWEGVIGGLLLLLAAITTLWWHVYENTSALQLLLLLSVASALGVMAIVGDLFQSQLKRFAGVKDSGALIPGHGGLFDRLDALLVVAPYYWLFVHYVPAVGTLVA